MTVVGAEQREYTAHESRRAPGILAVHLLLCILLIPLLSVLASGMGERSTIRAASVVYLGVVVWSYWSWYARTGSLLDVYSLFFSANMIFNGGRLLLEAFGQNAAALSGIYYTAPLSAEKDAALLVVQSTLALHLGALSVQSVSAGRDHAPRGDDQETSRYSRVLSSMRIVAWVLLALSVIPTAMMIRQYAAAVMQSGYAGIGEFVLPTGLESLNAKLSPFIGTAILYLLASSGRQRKLADLSLSILACFTVGMLLVGQRWMAFSLAIAYAVLWHRLIRPFSRWALLGAMITGLFVISPVVTTIRQSPLSELSASSVIESASTIGNPVVTSLAESGEAILPLAWTVAEVPLSHNYEYGASYLYAALTLVPNLSFWDIHPSAAHGSPSSWLSVDVLNYRGSRTIAGVGYSCIAEAYLNFGWIGTLVYMAVFGLLLARLAAWGERSRRPLRLVTVASAEVFLFFYARQDSHQIFRPLVWYVLVPSLLVLALCAYNDRKSVLDPLEAGEDRPA